MYFVGDTYFVSHILSLAISHKAVGTVSMAEIGLHKKHFNLEHLIKIADVLEIELCTLLEDLPV